ncbi:flap endonuclease [SAR202 cluster bacterium AD-804-J14_MRT_500m]|nr:flap endonuclease [SAR202 cluster bacterium AD-804-J14_MRT_500m]
MNLYLIDGTYELFRAYFSQPTYLSPDGRSVSAVRGIVQSLLALLRDDDVTHIGIAFDHVIPSFRNQMLNSYKTGSDTPADLLSQFPIAEQAASALGLVVWPMVEFEADDAIATSVARFRFDPVIKQIVICSPDKDFAQLVSNDKIVCLDRRRGIVINESLVHEKFGVQPQSIPDYLALVGDPADGIPGIPRWGAKGASALLDVYKHIENIPLDSSLWIVQPRGANAMSVSLKHGYPDALLYRSLTTLSTDVPIIETLDDLKWGGVPKDKFQAFCDEMGFGTIANSPKWWNYK